jgi:homoserine dehydrogenase
MVTDVTGEYSAIWRPYHYVGLELAQSIYSIALDKKSTGNTKFFNAEVVSVAKKDLLLGEILDGEGGFASRGRLINSRKSVSNNLLPIGLSDGAKIKKPIGKRLLLTLFLELINLPLEAKPPSPSSISPSNRSFLATDTTSALKNFVFPVDFLSRAIE